MSSLNSLPDLCLLAIFDRIPVGNLLSTVNLVNRRWHSLLPSAIARRQKNPLILVQSKEDFERSNGLDESNFDLMNHVVNEADDTPVRDLDRIKFESQNNAIVCDKLSTKACERLASLFPNLTSLHFIQLGASLSQIVQLNSLLFQWKPTLIHLKLWFWPSYHEAGIEDDDSCRIHFCSLFYSINSLDCLKQLDLDLRTPSYTRTIFFHQLPIVSQLEQLKITERGLFEKDNDDPVLGVKFPFGSLKLYGEPSMNLKKIFFEDDFHASHQMRLFSQFEPEFAKRFMRISLFDRIDTQNVQEFVNFFKKFSSLKCVNFRMSRISIAQLASVLVHLSHLEQLGLNISMEASNVPIDENDHKIKLPIFKSVKVLSIRLSSKSHTDFESLQLHRIFPSVQVIRFTLDSSQCSLCQYSSHNRHFLGFRRVQLKATATECVQQSLMPLKLFGKLRKVFISIFSPVNKNEKERCLTAEELFAEFGI